MGFIGLLMLFMMVDAQHDFPLVEIKLNNYSIAKQRQDKSWAIPVYADTKETIKKVIICIETDNVRCLRSN